MNGQETVAREMLCDLSVAFVRRPNLNGSIKWDVSLETGEEEIQMTSHNHVPSAILVMSAILSVGCGRQSATVDPARLSSFAALPESPTSGASASTAAKIGLG